MAKRDTSRIWSGPGNGASPPLRLENGHDVPQSDRRP
jgi:hypothetical protein